MAPSQHAGIYLRQSHVGESIQSKRGLRAELPLLLCLEDAGGCDGGDPKS